MHDNLDDDKKGQVKGSNKIRKKEIRDNLDDDNREQTRCNDKNERTNAWKLKMKENRFLILPMDAVWLIHFYNTSIRNNCYSGRSYLHP